jgi:D-glycero-D-manno-heptose 1,7-bisphosphate phosphatase
MKGKALFLDRDGTINVEKNYLYKIEEFVFRDGIFDLVKVFSERGYLIFVVTNQSGIAHLYKVKETGKIDWKDVIIY